MTLLKLILIVSIVTKEQSHLETYDNVNFSTFLKYIVSNWIPTWRFGELSGWLVLHMIYGSKIDVVFSLVGITKLGYIFWGLYVAPHDCGCSKEQKTDLKQRFTEIACIQFNLIIISCAQFKDISDFLDIGKLPIFTILTSYTIPIFRQGMYSMYISEVLCYEVLF